MTSNESLFSLAAAGITAFALVAAIFVSSGFAAAETASPAPSCTCPKNNVTARPKLAGLQAPYDLNDELSALETLQFALTEVADGSSYVWHRSNGRLSGIVKPVSSFKDTNGAVCRHVIVMLNGEDVTKKTETVACRMNNGVWKLDG